MKAYSSVFLTPLSPATSLTAALLNVLPSPLTPFTPFTSSPLPIARSVSTLPRSLVGVNNPFHVARKTGSRTFSVIPSSPVFFGTNAWISGCSEGSTPPGRTEYGLRFWKEGSLERDRSAASVRPLMTPK